VTLVYEWDEAKRAVNLQKHGLDFLAAHRVYESANKITYRIQELPEERFLDLALVEIEGVVLALVYTTRNGNVRFISFRRASRRERRKYAAAKP
jgi:uncharacterized DUF497 family protein